MDKLRAVVVGIGWAGRQHLAAYSAADGVELVGLSGLEESSLTALANEYGITHTFLNWEDLLAYGRFDVLSIAVPTELHAPIAIQALGRGVHVLCEKPMSVTVEDAERMVDAARSADRILEIVFNHRSHGEIRHIKSVIARGMIGTPYYAKVSWLRRHGMPSGWFLDRNRSGGGVLADLGIHLLDFALDILGEPGIDAVSASAYDTSSGITGMPVPWRPPGGNAVEDFATALIRLGNGAALNLEVGWAVSRPVAEELGVVIYAPHGGIESSIMLSRDRGTVHVYDRSGDSGKNSVVETAYVNGHGEVVNDFISHIRAGRDSWGSHDGSLALDRTRTIAACYESIATGREVIL